MRTLFVGVILMTTLLTGCFQNMPTERNSETTKLKEQIQILKLENINLKQSNKKLESQIAFMKENYEKENEIRNILDNRFYFIINNLRKENIEKIRGLTTENIQIRKGKIVSLVNGAEYEFVLPQNNHYFRQRFYHLEDDGKIFKTGYEIIEVGYDKLEVCYITFILEDGEWKLDYIDRDIG